MTDDGKTRRLAANIFSEWVQQSPLPQISLSFSTEEDEKAYQRKILMYRVASVLLGIINSTSRDTRFSPLQECMELLIFGPEPTPNSIERFNEIKRAMKHLDSLISEGEELTWAQGWLADLGHDKYNPVDLFAFSQYWLGHFASVSEYLDGLYPKPN